MKTILVDAVYTFIIVGTGIFKDMHKLLETYANRKIILTNANYEKFKEYGIDKMPYELFTLKHNPEKTDPEYFRILLKHFNLQSKDVIYFEHNIEAIKSAESVGIVSYHYDENKKDLAKLKDFIDKNI